jgi:hypothetical protein
VNFISQHLHDNRVCLVPAIIAEYEYILNAFEITITSLLQWIPSTSDKRGAARINPRARRSRGGLRPDIVAYVFAFSLLCYYLSIVQIKPFRPTPSNSAAESQSLWVGVNIFSRSAPARGPEIFFRHSHIPYWWNCKKQGLGLLCIPKTQFIFTYYARTIKY